MNTSISWWESVDRAEVIAAVRGLLRQGGLLVLEGDWESGRSQAVSVAEAELTAGGYLVRTITRDRTPSTTFEALAEAWGQLQGELNTYSLSAQAQVAGKSAPWLATELAKMLQNAAQRTALIFTDIDRDGNRAYNYHPVFKPLASQAHCPVVITFDPTAGPWSARGDIVKLRDFTREDVRECLNRSYVALGKSVPEIDSAVELVFRGQGGPAATVRPLTAYVRLHAWSQVTG